MDLIVRLLRPVAERNSFALKGGTAINLFLRDLPRLSVDIDLVYLSRDPWASAVLEIRRQLDQICDSAEKIIPRVQTPRSNSNVNVELKQVFRMPQHAHVAAHEVRIEVSPVFRGVVWPCSMQRVSPRVEMIFGFSEANLASHYDIYAGKMCAALTRQHCRDIFDILELLRNKEIDRKLIDTFLVYLISQKRPISEVIDPHIKEIDESQVANLNNMTFEKVSLDDLEHARRSLLQIVRSSLTSDDCEFLVSFKKMEPDWSLLKVPNVESLPAVTWKLLNLGKMTEDKHAVAVSRLRQVLDQL